MLTHKGTITIETERLILRRFRPEDDRAMFENWASDDAVTKYLTWPSHGSIDITRMVLADWVSGYDKPDFYQWAITLKAEGDNPIGSIGVTEQNDRVGKAEIGYCLGQQWWRRGIMTEALKAVMNYFFDEVGMRRIESHHDTRNPHSGDVMKKCGMKFEGTLRQAAWNNQGICDVNLYALLAQER